MESEAPDAGQGGAADAAAAEPQPRQGTKVSQKKVDQVKVRQHCCQCLSDCRSDHACHHVQLPDTCCALMGRIDQT